MNLLDLVERLVEDNPGAPKDCWWCHAPLLLYPHREDCPYIIAKRIIEPHTRDSKILYMVAEWKIETRKYHLQSTFFDSEDTARARAEWSHGQTGNIFAVLKTVAIVESKPGTTDIVWMEYQDG